MTEPTPRRYGPPPGCVGKTHHDDTHPWNQEAKDRTEHWTRRHVAGWLPVFRAAHPGCPFYTKASWFEARTVKKLISDIEHLSGLSIVFTAGRVYRFMVLP